MKFTQLGDERFKKHYYLISLTILTLTILMVFQNCAPVVEEAAFSSLNNLPFAYDSKADAVGYMSCNRTDTGANQNNYFSIKVSANTSAGGVRLAQGFVSATSGLSPITRQQLLAEGDLNGKAHLSLSIRPRVGGYNQMLRYNPNAVENFEYDNMLANLSSAAVAGPLTQLEASSPGARVQFFSGIQNRSNSKKIVTKFMN